MKIALIIVFVPIAIYWMLFTGAVFTVSKGGTIGAKPFNEK